MPFVYQMNNDNIITYLIGLSMHLQENVIYAFTFAVKSNGLFPSIFSHKKQHEPLRETKISLDKSFPL